MKGIIGHSTLWGSANWVSPTWKREKITIIFQELFQFIIQNKMFHIWMQVKVIERKGPKQKFLVQVLG